jgi:hypothetical protein
MHDDGSTPWLTAPAARCVGAQLAQADALTLQPDALALSRGDVETARWGLSTPRVPRLLVFDGD